MVFHYVWHFTFLLLVLGTLAGLCVLAVQHGKTEDTAGRVEGANTSVSTVGKTYRIPMRGPILYVSRPIEGEEARVLSSKLLEIESNSESQKEGVLSRKKRVAPLVALVIAYGVSMAGAGVATGFGINEIAHNIVDAQNAARARAREEEAELATELPDIFHDDNDPDYEDNADPLWIPISEDADTDAGACSLDCGKRG